ncbi:MAG: hypothetical protein GEU82_09240 [Luteitalea sp.]|nr:hypothetical protein [Luteitalea sp.]
MRHAVITALIVAAPRAAMACPVCFGQSDSPLANAINMGVIMMLGVVAVVLGSFASFFIYLNRRAKQLAAPGSPDGGHYAHPMSKTNPQEGTA